MKSFKVIAALVLVGVFLLGGLTMAMAAVTSPLVFPEAKAELTVRNGSAELQKSGSTVWVDVAEPTQVFPGDSVRTADESDASINLFDQGVLHVAENSTLTFEESLWNPEQPGVFQGEIFLEAGNLWARMFDFVTPESDFEVRTSSTVATVRGTTFWVTAQAGDRSRVYVDDHIVDVRSVGGSASREVSDGQAVQLERSGQGPILRTARLSGEEVKVVEKYRRWDKEYEDDLVARQLAFAHEVRKFDPETSLYNFQRFSEHVRLFMVLNESKQKDLQARFMAGRVLDAYIEYAERGDLTRAKILLQHAQEFGDREIAAYPVVRRAMMFFGQHRVTGTPDDLRQEIEEREVDKKLQETIGEDRNVDVTPGKQSPIESQPEPASDPKIDTQSQTTTDPQSDDGIDEHPIEQPMDLDPVPAEQVQYMQ